MLFRCIKNPSPRKLNFILYMKSLRSVESTAFHLVWDIFKKMVVLLCSCGIDQGNPERTVKVIPCVFVCVCVLINFIEVQIYTIMHVGFIKF